LQAHARRKYDEALKAESKNKCRAHKVINFISKLYKLETIGKNKKLSPQARDQLRQEKALPILMQFKAWLDEASNYHGQEKLAILKISSWCKGKYYTL
jgi:hypothetical protein|tara:strand:- start:1467 stop:1760 length:294 start_codon:yes stop_codon:yes gene_type:complete